MQMVQIEERVRVGSHWGNGMAWAFTSLALLGTLQPNLENITAAFKWLCLAV